MEIIYLGCNGYPFGMAQVERQGLIAKSLVGAGCKVTIINAVGPHDRNKVQLKTKGEWNGVDYIYTSGSPYRPTYPLFRKFLKIVGLIGEFTYIFKRGIFSKIDVAILSTHSFWTLKYYYFLSRILRFKIVPDYVEYSSVLSSSGQVSSKKLLFFDKYVPVYADYAICISKFLFDKMRIINPQLSILRIPPVCDIEKIDHIEDSKGQLPYFLYCGSAFYMEVVDFVLEAYNLSDSRGFYLYLIVNGKPHELARLNELVKNHPKTNTIKTYADLSFAELIKFYKQAAALLIPLRPTIQDEARFPHKIGEYTATGRPVITTNFGEIPAYFRNRHNALIAEKYIPAIFAREMEFIIDNPEQSESIGKEGRLTCERFFDYKIYGEKIVELINN
ncbi:MAG: glycosyltransferase [Bacteroidota bacterium]|nr:glycosyltransferase [Bacteroidota bacterium]